MEEICDLAATRDISIEITIKVLWRKAQEDSRLIGEHEKNIQIRARENARANQIGKVWGIWWNQQKSKSILSQIQIKGRWLNEQIYGGIKQNEWSVEPIAQSHSRVVE